MCVCVGMHITHAFIGSINCENKSPIWKLGHSARWRGTLYLMLHRTIDCAFSFSRAGWLLFSVLSLFSPRVDRLSRHSIPTYKWAPSLYQGIGCFSCTALFPFWDNLLNFSKLCYLRTVGNIPLRVLVSLKCNNVTVANTKAPGKSLWNLKCMTQIK